MAFDGSFDGFKWFLKTIFFSVVNSVSSKLERFYNEKRYNKSTFYLLTYLTGLIEGGYWNRRRVGYPAYGVFTLSVDCKSDAVHLHYGLNVRYQ